MIWETHGHKIHPHSPGMLIGNRKWKTESHILHLSVNERQFTSLSNETASFFLFLHSDFFCFPMHTAENDSLNPRSYNLGMPLNWAGSNSLSFKSPERHSDGLSLAYRLTSPKSCLPWANHFYSKKEEWDSMNLTLGVLSWG